MVIAAHPDDEVLGCGGAIARHTYAGDSVNVLFVADGETSRGMLAKPNRNLEAFEASKVLGTAPPQFLDYRDQMLDTLPLLEIVKAIEWYCLAISPTIVYTHHAGDLNLDHRIVHQAVMTACRPLPESTVEAIYAFEVLSSTEWGTAFWPDCFIDIDGVPMGQKLKALGCYSREIRLPPHARTFDAVIALAQLRGYSCGRHHAEAFMTLRSIVR